MDCLFCKIIQKTIPASITFEDEHVLAFHDISPEAPIHQLIIPKKHITSLNDLEEADKMLCGHLIHTAKMLAAKEGCAPNGYRLVMNCLADGGQTVFHVHMHLLAGRAFTWPPG
jgi:histidine triad (HIT) family protein